MDFMKRTEASMQGIVNILDVFIADSIDTEVLAEGLADKFVEKLRSFLEALDDGVGSNLVLVVDQGLILIDKLDHLGELTQIARKLLS